MYPKFNLLPMKKLFSFLRLNIIPIAGIFLLVFVFSACKKLDTQPEQPVAGLMAFNLVPDKVAVGVSISGNIFTNSPLYYTNYTGGYRGVFTGNRNLESYDYTSGESFATTSQLFKDSAYYSIFVMGANGDYRNVVVEDNLDSLPTTTGESFVRYVNAIPDSTQSPTVIISSNGTDVFNSAAAFATVSNFKGITPGDISIKVSNESTIDASRTILVEKGKIYTVLLTGVPNSTDSTKAVEIKFIENGEIAATQ